MSRYEEATTFIYELNIFDFDTPLSLSIFAHQICPAHLNSIKFLTLELTPQPLLRSQWTRSCDIIKGMQGLLEVRIRFHDLHNAGLGDREQELLEPLCKVKTKLDVFEVEVPRTATDGWVDREMEGAPFVLLRTVPSRKTHASWVFVPQTK